MAKCASIFMINVKLVYVKILFALSSLQVLHVDLVRMVSVVGMVKVHVFAALLQLMVVALVAVADALLQSVLHVLLMVFAILTIFLLLMCAMHLKPRHALVVLAQEIVQLVPVFVIQIPRHHLQLHHQLLHLPVVMVFVIKVKQMLHARQTVMIHVPVTEPLLVFLEESLHH